MSECEIIQIQVCSIGETTPGIKFRQSAIPSALMYVNQIIWINYGRINISMPAETLEELQMLRGCVRIKKIPAFAGIFKGRVVVISKALLSEKCCDCQQSCG